MGDHDLQQRDLPLPEAWPHHGYITTDASASDTILAVFAREGWKAEKAFNGSAGAGSPGAGSPGAGSPAPGFSLVRGWIEDHTVVEIGGNQRRAEYERFFAEAARRSTT